MNIAALDIGTNTVLLLIVESDGPPEFRPVADIHAIARLGEGIDSTGIISDSAYERFRVVLGAHMKEIARAGVTHIAAVATSAMRDAKNRNDILERIQGEFGISVETISGAFEAELTFRGALAGLDLPEGSERIGVVDIGGGSTEICLGSPAHFASGTSIDAGAVRMTERFFSERPVRSEQLKRALAAIGSLLSTPAVADASFDQLIAVAGTPTTLAAMDLELVQFDATRIHGYRLTAESIDRLILAMQVMDVAALTSRYSAVNKSRADILLSGSLILREAMRLFGVDSVLVSTQGLRYGVAIRELERAYHAPNTEWRLSAA